MAVFCDFENVALGVRDANYEKFDIKPILERLLLKGTIVVKKAYCDWDRYKSFKATMHEANFELIEIPHVRQSGKNSADIRLVVDALDLCYTKSHVNTFVIISGDSDFSPLVSKLRENAKQVIGVGVKQSTSDLLVANCDEFIFYDDLVRESRRTAAKRDARETPATAVKRTPDEEIRRKEKYELRKTQAIEMAVETFDALVSERGDSGKIWASMLKEAIKRRKPDFSESYYGFRTFGNLLEEAQTRGLLEFGRDEKSGAYVYRSNVAGTEAMPEAALFEAVVEPQESSGSGKSQESSGGGKSSRRNGRGGRNERTSRGGAPELAAEQAAFAEQMEAGADTGEQALKQPLKQQESRRGGRGARNERSGQRGAAVSGLAAEQAAFAEQMEAAEQPARESREPREPRRGGRGGRNERSSQRAKVEPEVLAEQAQLIETEEAVVQAAEPQQREPRRTERNERNERTGRGERASYRAAVAPEVEPEVAAEPAVIVLEQVEAEAPAPQARRTGRGARKEKLASVADEVLVLAPVEVLPVDAAPVAEARRSRKPAAKKAKPAAEVAPPAPLEVVQDVLAKPAARSRRPRKTEGE